MVSATYSRVINKVTQIYLPHLIRNTYTEMYRQVVQASAAKKLLTIV